MTKYSSEFKLKVVKYCVEDHHSRCGAARKFGMPSSTPLKEWIKKYKEHGTEGLIKQQKSSYRGEFKQNVLEYMQSNHLSATEAAVHFNLGSGSVVSTTRAVFETTRESQKYEIKAKEKISQRKQRRFSNRKPTS